MTHEQTVIDIADNPELRRHIAEAIRRDAGRGVLGTTGDSAGHRAAAGSCADGVAHCASFNGECVSGNPQLLAQPQSRAERMSPNAN